MGGRRAGGGEAREEKRKGWRREKGAKAGGGEGRGPLDLRRPWKGKDAPFIRPAAAGGGAAGGERRGLRAAAPLRRGAANCSTPGLP